LTKKFNKTLKSLFDKESCDWERLLPYILFAYCEVSQDTCTMGLSPFELLYGRKVGDVLKVE